MPIRTGRPQHKPTDEQRRQVLAMVGFGIPQLEIARLINISDRTLRTRYRRELDTGMTEANFRVAQALFTMATKDKIPAAAIWWTKCRMGWRAAGEPNGGDVPLQVDFRWQDAPPASSASEPAHEPPTIDAAAEDAAPEHAAIDAGPLLVWQQGED